MQQRTDLQGEPEDCYKERLRHTKPVAELVEDITRVKGTCRLKWEYFDRRERHLAYLSPVLFFEALLFLLPKFDYFDCFQFTQ